MWPILRDAFQATINASSFEGAFKTGEPPASLIQPKGRDLNQALASLQLANAPPSKFDNFYTPDNPDFYSASPYTPLNANRSEIRLLRVHPRRASDRYITCDLLPNVALSRVDGLFCVLSYCAGSPKNTRKIVVNGLLFNAFANLEHALDSACQAWAIRNPDQELMIWADQVCINQKDQSERASQVGIMRNIYRRGRETFICLSTPENRSDLSFSKVSSPKLLRTSEMASSSSTLSPKVVSMWAPSIQTELWGILGTDGLDQWIDYTKELFNCPWWSRAWVFQEFVVSPRVYFLAGHEQMALTDLSALMEFVYGGLEDVLDTWRVNNLDSIPVRDLRLKYGTEQKERVKVLQCNRYIRESNKRVEEENRRKQEDYHKAMDQREQNVLKRKQEIEAENIRRAVHNQQLEKEYDEAIKAWEKECREKEDRETEWLRADLKKQWNEAYDRFFNYSSFHSEAMKTMNDVEFKLNTISAHVEFTPPPKPARKPALPVLSFRDADVARPDLVRGEAAPLVALPRKDAAWGWMTLQEALPKIRSTAASSVINGKANRGELRNLKVLLEYSKHCQSSDPRDQIYAFVGLADEEYAIRPDYSYRNTIIQVLIHTARRIVEHEDSLAVLRHLRPGRRTALASYLPTWVPDWNKSRLSQTAGGESWEDVVANVRLRNKDDRAFTASLDEPAGASFASHDSDESTLDLVVHGVKIDVFRDPRESGKETALTHTFDIRNDLIVTTNPTADAGDEVWVLRGAAVPVALRRQGVGVYSLLGEALVCTAAALFSDIMFGELFRASHAVRRYGELRQITII